MLLKDLGITKVTAPLNEGDYAVTLSHMEHVSNEEGGYINVHFTVNQDGREESMIFWPRTEKNDIPYAFDFKHLARKLGKDIDTNKDINAQIKGKVITLYFSHGYTKDKVYYDRLQWQHYKGR